MNRIRRRRRNRRIALRVVVGLVAAYLLAGFFVMPLVLKRQLETRLTALLGRATTVEKVRTNPLTLSVTLLGFSVKEPDGGKEFLGWERLYVNAGAWGSLVRHWRVQDVTLEGFRAAVNVRPDGSLNVSDLMEKFAGTDGGEREGGAAPEPARPLHVGKVTIARAQVMVEDLSPAQPFRTTMGPVDFVLTDLHTGGGTDAPYRFAAISEAGERVEWSGTLHANPFRSAGALQVSSIVLGKYAPYSAPFTQADVRSGLLSLGGRYEVDLTEGARVLRWHEGHVALRQVEIVERTTDRLAIALPAVDLTGIEVDAVKRRATFAHLKVEGGKATVRREVDGSINLQTMLTTPASEQVAASAATPSATGDAKGFAVELAEFALNGFAAEWIDLAAPWPAQVEVADLAVAVRKLSTAPDAVMPLDLSLRWAAGGTVTSTGELTAGPEMSLSLQTTVTDLSLVPLGPYLEGVAHARIARGSVSTAHRARVTLKEPALDWNFEGEVSFADLAIEDTARGEETAGLVRLDVTGIQANPTSVFVGQVDVRGPAVRAVVAEDGGFNLAALVKTSPEPSGDSVPATEPPAGTAPAPMALAIHRVTVAGGDFSLVDRSVQPEVRIALADFGGTVTGLSSENFARAQVELKGSVDGVGPVSVSGRFDPLGPKPYVDLDVSLRNVDLARFSPYSARYAGFHLARGKLGVAVDFSLDGTQLDSGNVVTLDHFTFGAPSNSPDATKLPVRLAVALLKDTEGKILIDVPVKGRTDDPEFRVGRVVLRVIVNLLTKAAVSPFALLGSMFGGGGDELAFQAFAPGSAALLEGEKGKLATLEKALRDRPALGLTLEGAVDPEPDRTHLRSLRFEAQVRSRLAASGVPWPSEDPVVPTDHPDLIKQMFDETFPPGTELGTPLPPPPPVIPAPAPPAGAFRRVVDAITMKTRREQVAVEEENARRQAAHAVAIELASSQGMPLTQMIQRLEGAIEIGPEDLRQLAAARAEAVRQYFLAVGGINPERLILSPSADPVQQAQGAKVLLSLQ